MSEETIKKQLINSKISISFYTDFNFVRWLKGKPKFNKTSREQQKGSDHKLWKKNWEHTRYNKMIISCRKDAKYGNFVFTYVPETKTLHFHTPDGSTINIPNLIFPYGQEKIENAISKQVSLKGEEKKQFGKPIAWSIEDHHDYYIFKCMIEVEENSYTNHSKSDGILGLDMNVDHIAWANVNSIGQLINSGTFDFNVERKTTVKLTKFSKRSPFAWLT